MILYKYVPFAIGEKILEHQSVLFSSPKTFNDPFDTPYYPEEPTDDSSSAIFARLRAIGKNYVWAENTGILSLTRTPTNGLMWAHYADSHQGMVIGFDAGSAGFTDEASNLIPAQFGSVIYVSRRDTGPFASKPKTPLGVGITHPFPADHYEKLQRVFLHKPLIWSYEEEVRVLKSLEGIDEDGAQTPSGTFSVIATRDRRLHLYQLPQGSIREVYFGMRADLGRAEAIAHRLKRMNEEIRLFECILDLNEFSVGAKPYESIADAVPS